MRRRNGAVSSLLFQNGVADGANAAVGQTGTKTADKNSYDVTLSCESKEMPYEVLVGEGGVDLSSITD